ncbi:flagellar hook-basal body protein [bacterium]|nr:flagellar hook-basal body protein [bacterium]
MDAGLVTTLSGALAQSKQVEKIANNIANADTAGYKADELMFEEALQGAHHSDLRADIPERAFTTGELMSRAGDEKSVVLYGSEFTDMRAGAYKQTGNSLDFAIQGNGFFEVGTSDGVMLTRAGNFVVNGEGQLVTHEGHLVLGPGAAGADPTARAINVGSSKFNVDTEGNIYAGLDRGGVLLGQFSLVQVQDSSKLQKAGSGYFKALEGAVVPQGGAGAPARGVAVNPEEKPNVLGSTATMPVVHQGMLEASNVNAVKEMTKLIEAQRLFEQNTKLMQGFGELSAQASELGRF